MGLRVQLGHSPGVSCPFRTRGHKDFVIIDISGIHTIEVDFCGCDAALATPREQLLEVGWWPSTPLEPQSAATMTVLRSFHIWNLQGQISPTDFYRGLEQMTNGDGLLRVPVCGSIAVHVYADASKGSPSTVDVDGARMATHQDGEACWAWS